MPERSWDFDPSRAFPFRGAVASLHRRPLPSCRWLAPSRLGPGANGQSPTSGRCSPRKSVAIVRVIGPGDGPLLSWVFTPLQGFPPPTSGTGSHRHPPPRSADRSCGHPRRGGRSTGGLLRRLREPTADRPLSRPMCLPGVLASTSCSSPGRGA